MSIQKKFFRRNFLLIIKVKAKDLKIPIIVPIPLMLVEDLILAIAQLGRLGIALYFKLPLARDQARLGAVYTKYLKHLNSETFFQTFVELIQEIRSLGRLTILEVKDEGVHVSIKLY